MRKIVTCFLALLVVGIGPLSSSASAPQTDDQIRQAIIDDSIANYAGSCPCPYNVDRGGRRCGARSAYSRPGGEAPLCFPADVSDEMVASYRARAN